MHEEGSLAQPDPLPNATLRKSLVNNRWAIRSATPLFFRRCKWLLSGLWLPTDHIAACAKLYLLRVDLHIHF